MATVSPCLLCSSAVALVALLISSAASADDSMLVTTPWVRAKSLQRAQPAISASSFER